MTASAAEMRLHLQLEEKRRKLEAEKAYRDERDSYRRRVRGMIDKAAEEKRLLLEEAVAQREQEERERVAREKERLTKSFIRLKEGSAVRIRLDDTYYYGDTCSDGAAWVADRSGRLVLEGRTVYDGAHRRGEREGRGRYCFYGFDGDKEKGVDDDGDYKYANVEAGDARACEQYVGEWRRNLMHGRGTIISPSNCPENVLMYRGEEMCCKGDLYPGVPVELLSAESLASKRYARITIVKHIDGWRYSCRFEDEVINRDREVDLSTVGRFRVDRTAPRFLGVFPHMVPHSMTPKYPTPVPERAYSNMFESAACGIGWSREKETSVTKKVEKKNQTRRAHDESTKEAMVAAQQKQMIEAAVKSRRDDVDAVMKEEQEADTTAAVLRGRATRSSVHALVRRNSVINDTRRTSVGEGGDLRSSVGEDSQEKMIAFVQELL